MAIDDDEIFDVADAEPEPVVGNQPLYQIFEGSKIAVSKHVGPMWKKKIEASAKAWESVLAIWEEVYKYYNMHHMSTTTTDAGTFKRGDGTENLIFSNVNIMLPAIYSKDPDIACSTDDPDDKPLCESLEALINALFRRRDSLNAKPKIKRAAGIALLTNCGVLKLEFTKKNESRELAYADLERVTEELRHTKDVEDVQRLYGELEALEQLVEMREPSGFSLKTLLPQNLVIDAFAEQPDGCDGKFMGEKLLIPTNQLIAQYTRPTDPDDPDSERVLIYQPSHKAIFAGNDGERYGGIGLKTNIVNSTNNYSDGSTLEEAQRKAYLDMYYTECFMVWDKTMRRVMLFQCADWSWPLWVWDDPYELSRFFPYYIISYIMSLNGALGPGEIAYYLDQQDELNDMNRQMSIIRKAVFNFWYYDSSVIDQKQAQKFIDALRGVSKGGSADHLLGVKAEGQKIQDLIQSVSPPAKDYEILFDKQRPVEAANRISNTSDALRGSQFKAYTNVASVESYQESMRLSVGAKVDTIEDTVSDLALSVSELSVANMDQDQVAGLIGKKKAESWKNMTVREFNATYSLNLVAGSMEKPNSVFKKKEAIQVAQALGQFAQAAPGSVTKIMLKVLSQAFTEVVINDEDWNLISQEIQASMMKGVSTPGANQPPKEGEGGQPPVQPPAEGGPPQGGQPDIAALVAQMQGQGQPVQ